MFIHTSTPRCPWNSNTSEPWLPQQAFLWVTATHHLPWHIPAPRPQGADWHRSARFQQGLQHSPSSKTHQQAGVLWNITTHPGLDRGLPHIKDPESNDRRLPLKRRCCGFGRDSGNCPRTDALPYIYISNHLPSVVNPGTAVTLFADDCLIYRSINREADQLQLQKDLDALSTWGRCWGMKFNTSKCHILRVGNTKWTRFYHLNNDILTEVDNVNYLGVLFTNDMSWSPHISSIVSKAHQQLGFIRQNLRGSPSSARRSPTPAWLDPN